MNQSPKGTVPAAVGGSSVAVILAWLLGLVGLSVSVEVGVAMAGMLVSLALLVWHFGLVGIAKRIWRGNGS